MHIYEVLFQFVFFAFVLLSETGIAKAAFCPSYTPLVSNCAVEPVAGQNPSDDKWKLFFSKVSEGNVGLAGDGVWINDIETGCVIQSTTAAHFPCVILKAKVMLESHWTQFCVPTAPELTAKNVSQTIVSFDCGYGASQVTSGMRKGEKPSYDVARVASSPLYNLSVGAKILAEKWNAVGCVGDKNPNVIEHWYSALWAYNGLAYINNPNNPNLLATRQVYHPQRDANHASRWTYQERVFGLIENPPGEKWNAIKLAYPNRGGINVRNGAAALTNVNEPNCGSPTDCVTRRDTHQASCEDKQVNSKPLEQNDKAGDFTSDASRAREESSTLDEYSDAADHLARSQAKEKNEAKTEENKTTSGCHMAYFSSRRRPQTGRDPNPLLFSFWPSTLLLRPSFIWLVDSIKFIGFVVFAALRFFAQKKQEPPSAFRPK